MLTFLFLAFTFILNDSLPKLPPPGTVPFSENKYIDRNLIQNIDWKEFLLSIRNDSTDELYKKMIPDTSFKENGISPFNSRSSWNKPVSGITNEQVKIYCLWRSNLVTYYIANPDKVCKSGQKYYRNIGKTYKVIYSLPDPADLKIVKGKSLKVKSTDWEEMTAIENLSIVNSFSKEALEKKLLINNFKNQGFRCVAKYKKR